MKKINNKKIKGYIEGYYGKILNWYERESILKKLKQNNMNYYFYCPKGDIYHRQFWRKQYPLEWTRKFAEFCKIANKNSIKVIAGVSPGLDFKFSTTNSFSKIDFDLLRKKFQILIHNGCNEVALLFDDLPKNKNFNINEGILHARLANKISLKLNRKIFVVPKVYTDELIENKCDYISFFLKNLDRNIKIFYCGENIVSKSFKSKLKIINNIKKKGDLIYWDNFYANDYCPRKIFFGPYLNKNSLGKFMINGTGLVNTDMLILDIVNKCIKSSKITKTWRYVLKKNNIPDQVIKLKKFFSRPSFSNEKKFEKIIVKEDFFSNLDHLLWKWHSPLSKEWYQFLLGLKQDLQILKGDLHINRLLKTQTKPLQNLISIKRSCK